MNDLFPNNKLYAAFIFGFGFGPLPLIIEGAEPVPFNNISTTNPNDADINLPCNLSAELPLINCGESVILIEDEVFDINVGTTEYPFSTISNIIS